MNSNYEEKVCVYKITNKINQKVYIGQTNNYKVRKIQHESGYSKSSSIDKAIQKYGKQNFEWEILKNDLDRKTANYWESYYIEKFDTINTKIGYNLKGGGYNPFQTEEIKRKIGDAQKGELNHMFGKTGSLNKTSKPVMNITTSKKYESACECARIEEISFSHVCAVCRGDRGTVNGNIYRYIDKEGKIIEPEIQKAKPVRRSIKCVQTGIVYKNCNDAQRKLGYSGKNEIHEYFRNKKDKAYGFDWIYA